MTPAVLETASPASPAPAASVWSLVALGDSEVTGSGDPSGKGWVPYYADLVAAGAGREVVVENRGLNGLTSSGLRSAVESNAELRDVIAGADIVVLGIGGADVNAGDEALASGSCASTACSARDPATIEPLFEPSGPVSRVSCRLFEGVSELG